MMKELEFINIIKDQIGDEFIGDDCAYIKDLGITVTQDNFIEGIHFKKKWYSPYQLGYKSVAVNISDILASGAKPKYLTIGLSLPKNISNNFIEEFYKGAISVFPNTKIIGGDITSSLDKIFISITAIGSDNGRKIASRKNAKPNYVIIACSKFGESSKGLEELFKGGNNEDLIKAHIMPSLDIEFSETIATQILEDYAMMDTSDGLADALFKIAYASKVTIKANYIEGMFGAEDYKLVAVVPEKFLEKITNFYIIGSVHEFDGNILYIDNTPYNNYDDLNLYNHFGE